jgi:protein TonB
MGVLKPNPIIKTLGGIFKSNKFLGAAGSGLVVTLGLFYLMSQLISGGANLNKSDDSENFIEFVRIKKESLVQERKRQKSKKPPEPKKPPPPKKLSLAADEPNKPQMNMKLPKLSTSLKGNGPYLGGAGSGGAGNMLTPIVRIEPQFPRKAAMQGIEGHVVLSFEVTETGTVDKVEVVSSKPRRIFDMSAKRAVLKWKYKPQTDDGKPVRVAQKVQLDFKLTQ